MPPDQLRSPTAIKNLLRPLELTVTERSLKKGRAGSFRSAEGPPTYLRPSFKRP
jgi:hypothetical protein